ncbi:hypothetical protein BLNAU_23097 [Blattamonas nauphoetae]|uniref:Uncharacterized protein n=1 Tax=Blattamonas nauphoetae TaxID=2049346 RepID=A0ABQ9WUA4_9EUKA|nr:hypothetical protein BLNAU_23097 [Blattamonas nauphoetae]
MSHISLDSGWRGTSVGRISSSRLTIDNCPIISNPESSPFVMDNGWDDIGSSIFFVDCSHRSIDKSSLLALVSLTPSHTTHSRHTDTEQEVSSALVSCSGLSLCDTDLVFGSGPLVGFSSWTEQDTGLWTKLETVLIGSRLVNMTSGELRGSGKGNEALEGFSGCQKILDSSVTLSTNHLCGTTCIVMNLGGSLLCSNSSFSHCQDSLEPSYTYPDITLIHKTISAGYSFSRHQPYNFTFRRCTFLSMTRTSIYLWDTTGSLAVSESSFSNCSAATSHGGAICFNHFPYHLPISISSSLFVDCSAEQGGAVCVSPASDCTIVNVLFRNNSATTRGGALSMMSVDRFTLSNCAFELCVVGTASNSYGGGVCLYNDPSPTMDSVLFRECSALKGNDFAYPASLPIQTHPPSFTNCDSTSQMSNVYILSFGVLDETLIPAVPDTSTANLVGIVSTPTADQTSSKIQMKVSQNVDGKMLVLVDNTNNHEPPNDDSSPAIGRLLTFEFISSTDSATQEVSFGEWEKLQYGSIYCVIGSSIAKTRLSFSSIGLTTPNPARIVQLVCSLGSGTDHCWLQLKGRTLPKGRYTVKLVGIDDFSFSIEFDGTTGLNTLNMFSSRHSESLFGAGSKLSFSTTYEVESVTFEDDTEPFFLDPPRLIFTTPAEQPRLISVGTVSFKDDSKKDIVLIPLVGVICQTTNICSNSVRRHRSLSLSQLCFPQVTQEQSKLLFIRTTPTKSN